MKVRFIEAVVGPDILAGTGEVKDLPRSDAKYWIRVGLAEEFDDEPSVAEVTVQEIKKTAKRVIKNVQKTNNSADRVVRRASRGKKTP